MFLNSVHIRISSSSRGSTGVEYILCFMRPHKKKSHSVKSGDRGGHEIGPPLSIQFPGCLLFKYYFTR